MFHVISDVHGNLEILNHLIEKCPGNIETIILNGDIGFGFVPTEQIMERLFAYPNKKFLVIQGNHDNANEMTTDTKNVVFFTTFHGNVQVLFKDKLVQLIPGALSYDKQFRVPGISWWSNEEMSYRELRYVCSHIIDTKPSIIVSHDAPLSQYSKFFQSTKAGITNSFLEVLRDAIDWPVTWIHGHLHQSYFEQTKFISFIGIGEDGYVTVY